MIEALLASAGLSAAGGALGALGGQNAAEDMREALAAAIAAARENVQDESRIERERALARINRAERQIQKSWTTANQRADADLFNAMASPMYQQAAGYIQSMFAEGLPSSLAADLSGRLRSAQTARGLESGGAAIQNEARFLSTAAAEQRQALLPMLQQMALEPTMLKQQLTSSYLQNLTGAQGLGYGQFSAQTGGLAAGEQMAASRYGAMNSVLAGLTQQMPSSAQSPTANALLAAGGGLASMLAGLFGG